MVNSVYGIARICYTKYGKRMTFSIWKINYSLWEEGGGCKVEFPDDVIVDLGIVPVTSSPMRMCIGT